MEWGPRMASEDVLVPLEERNVDFYGDEITAVLVEAASGPDVYVPVRPLCDYLGLAWSGQYERIKRDPVLADALRTVRVTRTEAGRRETICLPLEMLPGWLFGISTTRVRPELQDKILRYRRECFRVLWQAFQADALSLVEHGALPAQAMPAAPSAALMQIREMGLAIVQMAEQQMALEQRVTAVDGRMDRAAQVVGELRRRLSIVERRLDPMGRISDEQASEISNRVKALAEVMTEKQPGKNNYQGIFGELYRRFGVSSYKLIAHDRYEQVLSFLEAWRVSVTMPDDSVH